MSDSAEAVRRVIAEETGRELHHLGLETNLRRDLGLDEEDVAHILREVESELDVVFDADAPAEVDTVGRLIRMAQLQRGGLPFRRRTRTVR